MPQSLSPRTLIALVLGAAGFMLFMAGIMLATIDLALQYEVQGFFIWEAILTVATGFVFAGLIAAGFASLIYYGVRARDPRMQHARGDLALDAQVGLAH